MREMELYKLWLENATEDPDLISELKSIEGNEEEIKDRFYRDMEFGTAGLRGVIGAGTFRLNIYTIRQATQGLSDYVNGAFSNASVAIAYDSRIKSDVFAKEAARVLAGNGIKAYLYSELMPTPMLSWAVRYLGCKAGIVVTASHNPSKYNGYKAYGADGCQMTTESADIVYSAIQKTPMFGGAKLIDFDEALKNGMIEYIGQDVISAYLDEVQKQQVHPEITPTSGLKVVYTPLNGTGNKPVREILKRIGISDVTVVPEQENPDGNFPTCPFPNPEIKEALARGLELCKTVKPDLLLATDPDCDRVGIAVPDSEGNYVLFSGNEVGALLLEYICKERIALGTMPERPVAVKSIVTTEIASAIAREYGVELRNVLTGFKFIGEQIGYLEAAGEADRYIFGFEESYGYLAGSYVRDKDAVVGSMMICDMAAFYRSKGISLLEAREALYKKYGNYCHSVGNFVCEGAAGMTEMAELMHRVHAEPFKEIAGFRVVGLADYEKRVDTDLLTGAETPINLPKSDVLQFRLENGSSVIIRPSGTEPKIKGYYTAIAPTHDEAQVLCNKLASDFKAKLGF